MRVPALAGGVGLVLAIHGVAVHAAAHGLRLSGLSPSPYLEAWKPDPRPAATLREAVAEACAAPRRFVIVGVEFPSLNANSASFYGAQMRRRTKRPSCFFTSFGLAETDLDRAFARLDALRAVSVITVPPERMPPVNAFNQVSRPAVERLRGDPRFTVRPLAGGDVLLFESADR